MSARLSAEVLRKFRGDCHVSQRGDREVLRRLAETTNPHEQRAAKVAEMPYFYTSTIMTLTIINITMITFTSITITINITIIIAIIISSGIIISIIMGPPAALPRRRAAGAQQSAPRS